MRRYFMFVHNSVSDQKYGSTLRIYYTQCFPFYVRKCQLCIQLKFTFSFGSTKHAEAKGIFHEVTTFMSIIHFFHLPIFVEDVSVTSIDIGMCTGFIESYILWTCPPMSVPLFNVHFYYWRVNIDQTQPCQCKAQVVHSHHIGPNSFTNSYFEVIPLSTRVNTNSYIRMSQCKRPI